MVYTKVFHFKFIMTKQVETDCITTNNHVYQIVYKFKIHNKTFVTKPTFIIVYNSILNYITSHVVAHNTQVT